MKAQHLILSLTLIALFLVSAPFVHAQSYVLFSHDAGSSNGGGAGIYAGHPSLNSSLSGSGIVFNTTTTGYVYSVNVYLYHINDPDGFVGCRIGGVEGNLADNTAKPNATIFSQSSNLIQINQTTTPAHYTFNFNASYQLVANTVYSVYLYGVQDGHNGDTTHALLVYYDIEDDEDSQMAQFHNGGWFSGADMVGSYNGSYRMIIYGVADMVNASSSPPATPPPGSTGTNELIDTFVDYLIPLILFLLPALILGWLTHWEKWPILIGLAIGAGLTYLFMGTEYLWLVILVVIGIGASAYQSSRGG